MHSRNPFIEGEEPPIIALLAAGALCDIGSGESRSAKNFEFQPGVTNNGNFLSFGQMILVGWPFLILKLECLPVSFSMLLLE